MPRSAVTNVGCLARAVSLLVAASCSGGATSPQGGPLSAAQQDVCRRVERAYRENAPDYPAQRDAAVQDAAITAWLVRVFVLDVFRAREQRPLGKDEDVLRAAARIGVPLESRAIAEIVALGAKAVPVLVADLLLHDQPQPRELGVELLVRIGASASPDLRDVALRGEKRERRAAARALAAIGVDGETLAVLRQLASDGDFTVRADAVRGIHDGGVPARDLLVARVAKDEDAFVRRVAAQALSHFPDAVAARTLVDYLARCDAENDRQGAIVAQASLQGIAGTRGMRTVAEWRAFAAALEEAPGAGGARTRR